MVALTGPGDPFATPDITLAVIKKVREDYPNLKIGIHTLGIGGSQIAGELAAAGVSQIVVSVEGVRAEILEKIYAWIRPGSKTLKLSNAVELLLQEQRNTVSALKFHNLEIQIQSTVYPGYNSDHIPKIGAEMVELGADTISLLPYEAGPEVEVELESPTCEMMSKLNTKTGEYLRVSQPLILPQDYGQGQGCGSSNSPLMPKPKPDRPNVAVASSNGIEIDLHLGHAMTFLVYGPREDGLACLLETRQAPAAGSGNKRWEQLGQILSDCFVLLATSAGETPRKALAENGLKVVTSTDNIEGTVDVLYGGGKKKKKK